MSEGKMGLDWVEYLWIYFHKSQSYNSFFFFNQLDGEQRLYLLKQIFFFRL